MHACRDTIDSSWHKAKIDQKQFDSFLRHHQKHITDYDSLLVIPGVGCTGCITNAQSFYYDHKESPKILFIFTDIQDPKIFRQEVPDSLWQRPNIIVDLDDRWPEVDFQSIYPGLFRIYNKKLFYKIFES